jgi:hypothetical protein
MERLQPFSQTPNTFLKIERQAKGPAPIRRLS